jgi:hypothetical protein
VNYIIIIRDLLELTVAPKPPNVINSTLGSGGLSWPEGQFSLSLFFFLAVLGFELRALPLLGRCSWAWDTPLVLRGNSHGHVSSLKSQLCKTWCFRKLLRPQTYVSCLSSISFTPPSAAFYRKGEGLIKLKMVNWHPHSQPSRTYRKNPPPRPTKLSCPTLRVLQKLLANSEITGEKIPPERQARLQSGMRRGKACQPLPCVIHASSPCRSLLNI